MIFFYVITTFIQAEHKVIYAQQMCLIFGPLRACADTSICCPLLASILPTC